MSLGWSLAAVPLLIAMNAFFVVSEYAVVAMRPAQIAGLQASGRRRAAAAIAELQANPASAIGAIQVCITMTNLLLGWIGEPAMSTLLQKAFGPAIALAPHLLSPVSVLLSFVIVTMLTVVFSELLPKALTLRYVEPAAAVTAVPTLAIRRSIFPLVWVMNRMANLVTKPLGLGSVEDLETQSITADELRLMAIEAGRQGVVSPRARSLVLNSLAIGRRTAEQIMVPRTRVGYLDLQRSMEENFHSAESHLFSQMPLTDGGMDKVIGVILTREFLTAYHAGGDSAVLSLIARPPVFMPETISLDRLIEAFHESQTNMVFLVDEYGGVEGIVTLRDVMDELVDELGIPSDAAPESRSA
jgi:CBS domain containing-hemolysin-like protein